MTSTDNPWIHGGTARAAEGTAAPTTRTVDEPAPPTGPLAPQPAVPPPDAVDRLPRRLVAASTGVWWVGAHGGSGESTLERLMPGSRGSGHAWPRLAEDAGARAPVKAVLVARGDLRGLTAAQRAATEWASGSVDGVVLLGLVILADAPGRLPRALKDFAAVVAGGVPRVWHLPWVEAWRVGDLDPAAAPRQVRRLLHDVRQLVPQPAAPRGTD
jgi:hypothetical protein